MQGPFRAASICHLTLLLLHSPPRLIPFTILFSIQHFFSHFSVLFTQTSSFIKKSCLLLLLQGKWLQHLHSLCMLGTSDANFQLFAFTWKKLRVLCTVMCFRAKAGWSACYMRWQQWVHSKRCSEFIDTMICLERRIWCIYIYLI